MKIDSPIRGLSSTMSAATVLAFTLALLGAFLRGTGGSIAAVAAIGVVVAVPLLRLVVLGAHWWRIGDRRFAAAAIAVLAIVGSGALLAML